MNRIEKERKRELNSLEVKEKKARYYKEITEIVRNVIYTLIALATLLKMLV
ncbi:hypothetical protein [Staphylococcus chromogenes]|uniref:hypothetical protein n=1 Tax=Staphylococcus chromogenes TaxID=46126 RepID=UPI002885A739|nr:hypothetical protein [Staphylococcus chromogenes]MDT0700416.1 hypothetical protein [Staphylococcus chromogenes]